MSRAAFSEWQPLALCVYWTHGVWLVESRCAINININIHWAWETEYQKECKCFTNNSYIDYTLNDIF